ncbi:MAG: DUF6873 family GME fold protein [Syntrophomonadaceae bacterium]
MQIIIDRKMPEKAKNTLSRFGSLIELATSGITYEAISGHPDIFFFQAPSVLITAPNLPKEYFRILDENKINYVLGNSPVGAKYPDTARYNAVSGGKFLIHNKDITEKEILHHLKEKEILHVSQGYCRCSLLGLKGESFITSDGGIYKALIKAGLNVLYVSASDVMLPGLKHGFFGGACGLHDDKVFISGSLKNHPQHSEIKSFIQANGYEIVELCEGPLFDAGSIFFIDEVDFRKGK